MRRHLAGEETDFVARRLILTNGDWTTRHELGEASIVIGRDPHCDLFFVNQKLSRRHARVEPGPDGVTLVDLGSRNGVWVNEKKIGEHRLAPGDSIRLGGLRMVYEEDDAEPTLELGRLDATVMVAGVGSRAPAPPAPPAPEDTTLQKETDPESPNATVVLSDGSPDRTVILREPEANGAATVMLAGSGAPRPAELDASTRILASSDATQRVAEEEPILVPEPEPPAVRVRQRLEAWSWEAKFSAALFALSGVLCGLLVWVVAVGSPVALVLYGLLLAGLLALLATILARELLVRPMVRLRRDAEGLDDGESLSAVREYRELQELAKSINRLAGRTPRTDTEDRG